MKTNILRQWWVSLAGYVCFTMVSYMLQKPVISDSGGSVWLGMFVSLWSATCCKDQCSQTVVGQSGWVCLFHYGQPHAAKTSVLRQWWVSLAGYVCFTMVSYMLQRPVFSDSGGSVWLGMFVSLWSATCCKDQYSQTVLGQSGWVCLFHCGQPHAAKTSILRQCWVSLARYVCFTVVSYMLQKPVFSDNVGSVWLFTHFEWKYLADRPDITALVEWV